MPVVIEKLFLLVHNDSAMEKMLTDSNFDEEVKSATAPVMVDFWASWCGPCRLMAPIVDELTKEMEGKVTIAKLDVDANQMTAIKFGVMSIPTTIFFKEGKEVQRLVGYQNKATLVNAINSLLAS